MPTLFASRRRPRTLPFTGQAAALVVGEAGAVGVRARRGGPGSPRAGSLWPTVTAGWDPAGEEKNDESERRRQPVYGASVPEEPGPVQGSSDSSSCAIRLGRVPGPRASGEYMECADLSRDPASAEFPGGIETPPRSAAITRWLATLPEVMPRIPERGTGGLAHPRRCRALRAACGSSRW